MPRNKSHTQFIGENVPSIPSSIGKISRHRSLTKQRPRATRIIHITIRPKTTYHQDPPRKPSIPRSCKSLGRTTGVIKVHRVSPLQSSARTQSDRTIVSTKTLTDTFSQKHMSDCFDHLKTMDSKSDRTGVTQDFHQNRKRNEKRKCKRPCIMACVLAAFILGIILMISLLVTLIKPQRTEATTIIAATSTKLLINPCVSGILWNTTGALYAGDTVQGSALNQLSSPNGLFINANDALYINDGGNFRVLKYLPGATSGIVAAGTSVIGNALNQISTNARFSYVDSNENIYISDTNNHRVVRWANGASTGVIVAGNGSFGASLGQVRNPFGIWVDSNSNVFVVENQNHRVTMWTPGATAGVVVAGGNGQGTTTDKLSSPSGLSYDEINQDLYIANSGSNIVLKWHVNASTGDVVAGVAGTTGSSSTLLNFPLGITLDRWNNLYVVDRSNSRIQLFCHGNLTGIAIAGMSTGGSSLSIPYGIALDSQLNLYVSENGFWRVTRFTKL